MVFLLDTMIGTVSFPHFRQVELVVALESHSKSVSGLIKNSRSSIIIGTDLTGEVVNHSKVFVLI